MTWHIFIGCNITNRMAEELFDGRLLVHTQQNGLVLRPLCSDDYEKGHCVVLSQLTVVGDVTKDEWLAMFRKMKSRDGAYFIVVVENVQEKKIVGSGTLFIEDKIIRNCGRCGHIEDIVVDSKCRGKNVGLWIIETLRSLAQRVGCYKLILDCSEKNVPFYEKCGFARKEVQMVQYFQKSKL